MTLIALYEQRVASGGIVHDPAQAEAARRLDEFLVRWKTKQGLKNGLLRRLARGRGRPAAVKGAYVFGGVGRGKTMLMDLLAGLMAGPRTRRVHFHAFMLEIHARLKHLRDKGHTDDFLGRVAEDIATDTDLLCFDELHVNDIADAMILGPLFAALFKNGVGVIATSNYAPDDLYKGGLQRARFLPFIDLIKKNMDVIHLDSPTDYRMRALSEQGTWFYPLTDHSWGAMHALFETLTGHRFGPDVIHVDGRTLPVMQAGGRNAWLSFDTLCREARGAVDYLALASVFETIFVDAVPRLNEETRNEARRFMTLIDTLYDQKKVLVVRAAVRPDQLYGGETHGFEFQRTVSRLLEMQSSQWLSHRMSAQTSVA